MNPITPKLEYRTPEVPHPPPRLRLGVVSIGISLFCFGGALLTLLQVNRISPTVINAELKYISWTLSASILIAIAGLFQRGGRVLSVGALIIAAIGGILLPMLSLA
jgi:hypothetical protein